MQHGRSNTAGRPGSRQSARVVQLLTVDPRGKRHRNWRNDRSIKLIYKVAREAAGGEDGEAATAAESERVIERPALI